MNPLRKKLEKRAQQQTALTAGITPKELCKSPSQKRSEAAKKKELKRAGVQNIAATEPAEDCHTCSQRQCGKTPSACHERTMVHRCKKCGRKVRHYIDPEVAWEFCPVCKERREE